MCNLFIFHLYNISRARATGAVFSCVCHVPVWLCVLHIVLLTLLKKREEKSDVVSVSACRPNRLSVKQKAVNH